MPEQKTISPAVIADQLGVTIITLRRWCSTFGDHLSPLANPESGQPRRFTYRDREVLKHIRSLREQGRSLAEIGDQLGDISFPEIDDPVDNQPVAQVLPATLPEDQITTFSGSQTALATQQVESIVMAEIASLRLEIRDIKQSSRSYVSGLAAGFILALGFMIVILLLASLYGR